MNRIQLPNQPTNLPPTSEVRDFDLGNNCYARVIMELSTIREGSGDSQQEYYAITAQCFEMNADGTFKQAPNGYPSRSNSTTHTIPASALGVTMQMDDGWVRRSMNHDPATETIEQTDGAPTGPAEYGDLRQDSNTSQVYVYTKGWADTVAETKIGDMVRVLATSNIRSGLGFR